MGKAYDITPLAKDYNNFEIGSDCKIRLKSGVELVNSRTGAPLSLNNIINRESINIVRERLGFYEWERPKITKNPQQHCHKLAENSMC